MQVRTQQAEEWHALHLMYEASRSGPDDLDVMRSESLARMRAIEASILSLPGYEQFCYRPDGLEAPCDAPHSPTSLVLNPVGASAVDTRAFGAPRGTELVDACMCMHTHAHMHTHACACTHMHAHARTCTRRCATRDRAGRRSRLLHARLQRLPPSALDAHLVQAGRVLPPRRG